MEKKDNRLRLAVFFVMFLLFGGLLTYSLLKVRYDVSGTSETEPSITEKSIPHGIERGLNGGLVYTDRTDSAGSEPDTATDTGITTPPAAEPEEAGQKPCPT